jgi:hypothetical protein
MSDLQLEAVNTEVKQTTLIGAPGDLGTGKIKDFTGAHVLECIPDSSLLNSSVPTNNFGGILGRGVGTGVGVRGLSTRGAGVLGEASDAEGAGVQGSHGDTGVGVLGKGNPGVVGSCRTPPPSSPRTRIQPTPGELAGVRGESVAGPGVFGEGHIGGQFTGTAAQLSLVPGPSAGKPTSGVHHMGEIYLDSAASLFICIAGGTPGTWVKVVVA